MEGNNTLADNLLDDLDDLSDVEQEETTPDVKEGEEKALNNRQDRLLDQSSLQTHLKALSDSSNTDEHALLTQSNHFLAQIRDEITQVHGELCTAYHAKFPELEELLKDPHEYQRVVVVLGPKTMDLTSVNEKLQFLTNHQVIALSVAGSTTAGRPLTESEWALVEPLVAYLDRLWETQRQLREWVEARMEGYSVTALIGPSLTAQLLGLAGGWAALSKIPACNLQVLGQHHTSRAGTTVSNSHQGILIQSDLVQSVPQAMQRKALKAVAAKVALAARVDLVNLHRPSTTTGDKFRTELEDKFQKWMEPDKARVLKALPKPDLTIKKRRGGKRMRKMKERFEETAMMQQANTRAFSTQTGEYGDDAMGLTRGLLDTADIQATGSIRRVTEKKKMRMANTKASRKRQAQMTAKAQTNGLSTSVVFTPVQGLELVNPDAAKERVKEANKKWFSDDAGFKSALPKK